MKLTKQQAKDIRWLMKAIDKKNYREYMRYINTSYGAMATSDDKRLQVIPPIPDIPIAKGILPTTKLPANECNVEFSVSGEDMFPAWREVIPNGEPITTIIINPKYLRDAIHDAKDPIRITFHGKTSPLEIETSEDEHRYTLIMPLSNHNNLPNRTYKPK